MLCCKSGIIYSGSGSSSDFLRPTYRDPEKIPDMTPNILYMLENCKKMPFKQSKRRNNQQFSVLTLNKHFTVFLPFWTILLFSSGSGSETIPDPGKNGY